MTLKRTNTLVLCLILTAIPYNIYVKGETYIVRDADGWNLFTNSTDWAAGKEFHIGDTLMFNYDRDLHNVMQVNSTAYRDCIKEPYTRVLNSGNDSLVLADIGESWYICAMSNHCENGQMLNILVVP